jgi:hypothetical protein
MKAQFSFSYSVEMEPDEYREGARIVRRGIKSLEQLVVTGRQTGQEGHLDLISALTQLARVALARGIVPPFTMPDGPPDFTMPGGESKEKGQGDEGQGENPENSDNSENSDNADYGWR